MLRDVNDVASEAVREKTEMADWVVAMVVRDTFALPNCQAVTEVWSSFTDCSSAPLARTDSGGKDAGLSIWFQSDVLEGAALSERQSEDTPKVRFSNDFSAFASPSRIHCLGRWFKIPTCAPVQAEQVHVQESHQRPPAEAWLRSVRTNEQKTSRA